jgi:hypothetical protein
MSFVQATNAALTATAATPATISLTAVASKGTIVLTLEIQSSTANVAATVTPDGIAMTQVVKYTDSGFAEQFMVLVATGVSAGTKTCSISTDTTIALGAVMAEYTPSAGAESNSAHQSQTAPGTGVGALNSTTYTAPTSGDTIVGIFWEMTSSGIANDMVAAGGSTLRFNPTMTVNGVGRNPMLEDKVASGTVSSTATAPTRGGTDSFNSISIAIMQPVAYGIGLDQEF